MANNRKRKSSARSIEGQGHSDSSFKLKKVNQPVEHRNHIKPINLSRPDFLICIILVILASLTRIYRISEPPAVVFDELHFSKFSDRILTGTWFFDIHPPLGKLILAYGSRLLGYHADPTFVIEKVGHIYPVHVKYMLVRCVAAFFSIWTVPLTYIIARILDVSRIGGVLSGTMVLFDFIGTIEGRLILMDSQLLFFCQLSLLCALILWRQDPLSVFRSPMVIITGLAAGAALSIKHTALATPGLIAVISFLGIHYLEFPLMFQECLLAGICGFFVYGGSFLIMFRLLWLTGGKYDRFMPIHFRKTLKGAAEYDHTAKRISFLRLFLYLNKRMVASNASIKKRHNWESSWYHWIINWRGVLYYTFKEEKNGVRYKSQIYLMGNPVVIYLVLACVVLFTFLLLLSIRYRRAFNQMRQYQKLRWMRGNGVFLLFGWLCNLLPYILVDRAAFIYHYLPGLFYGQLLCGVVVDFLPTKPRILGVTLVIASMVFAFVYWSPWIYGFPLTDAQHAKRRLLPKWN